MKLRLQAGSGDRGGDKGGKEKGQILSSLHRGPLASMEEWRVRGQKHLQFSAISRHFEATKWSLCVECIVAVDPREREKGALVTRRALACILRHWRHSDAPPPNAWPLGKISITRSQHSPYTLYSCFPSSLPETTAGIYGGRELGRS